MLQVDTVYHTRPYILKFQYQHVLKVILFEFHNGSQFSEN